MNQIQLNNYEIVLPGCWNELSKEQLLYLASDFDVWQLLVKNNISLGKSKAFILLSLLNVTPQKIVSSSNRFLGLFTSKKNRAIANVVVNATPEVLEELLQLTDFVFAQNILTDNKLFELKHNKETFIGPKSKCENIRYGEFVYAEEYFKAYINTGDEKYLTLMVATLYRPAKTEYNLEAHDTDGDIREKFNQFNVDLRAQKFETLSKATKNAVMLFYAGCRQQMVSQNPEVFGTGTQENTPSAKSQSWPELLLKMARNKNVDDEVLQQKLMSTILMELTQISIENREIERQNGKH